ncbi:hypothetical protein PV682_04420 [Streptomyces niveiscabiei]|uniref:hypothetical protein n=1 Tax=Streptomyces niveiscabiei TaxID=164115 RepID=UPI0029B64616|nr:hypothetical protein [Streptomyces niveiscabiei]MDX3380692.1 hypothetical protein [Streptomyces niveiscabiei]
MTSQGQAVNGMLHAYGRWFEHARKCGECYATDKCATAQKLWNAYLDIKRGSEAR